MKFVLLHAALPALGIFAEVQRSKTVGAIMAKKGYGQFCPVSMAAELLAERWMPVVVRELLAGSHRFSDLRRGIPLISPATLSQRLRELVDAGILDRARAEGGSGRVEYALTEAGEELRPIIRSFGVWGERWARHEIRREDVDPRLLIWAMHRHLHLKELPADRVVLQFRVSGRRNQVEALLVHHRPPRARGRVPQESRSRGGPDARDEHPDDDDGLPG